MVAGTAFVLATATGAAASGGSPLGIPHKSALTGTILVTVNGNLGLLKPSGAITMITTGGHIGDADFSPDGRRIAFHKGATGARDLYLVKADGTGLTQLTNTPGVDETYPSWSPDGSKIAFSRMWKSAANPGGIAIMAARTGAPATLIKRNTTDGESVYTWERPDWSPRGGKIAVENWENYLLGHSYSSVRVLTPTGGVLGPYIRDSIQPTFNPAGTKIAASYYRYDEPSHIQVLTLPNTRLDVYNRADTDPVWSPDGTAIATVCGTDLCAMRADGSGIRTIKNGSTTYRIVPRSWRGF